MIDKSVCAILGKLTCIDPANYSDSELVSHALSFNQFDIVVRLSQNNKSTCELVVRKFLALTGGENFDTSYLHLLARIPLDLLDHEIKLRLVDHLLRIEFNTDSHRSLFDSISRVLVKMILAREQNQEPAAELV